ncbi:MAG: hypothetical protein H0V33_04030 [Acidimicrobiia bacterium]|nr:hypothetical protein [Acidimicrobiia bacterium]
MRIDGIDTATGRHRSSQLGTFRSQRAAVGAARTSLSDGHLAERGTPGWLVHRYVASRTDVS